MEILEKKSSMLYKSESGNKIMVKISLPYSESDSEMNTLYSNLEQRYRSMAQRFISFANEKLYKTYFLSVGYKSEISEKSLRIRRTVSLRCENRVIKESVSTDFFTKDDLRLKK